MESELYLWHSHECSISGDGIIILKRKVETTDEEKKIQF